ncbi:RNAPII degradation factor, partial [Cryomyces antarcticus]
GNAGEQAGTATTTDKSAERLGGLGSVVASEITPAAASEGAKSSMIPEGGAQKSWASLLAKPKLAPVPQKPAALAPPLAEIGLPPAEPITSDAVREETVEPEALPPSPITEEPLAQELPTADTETTLLQNPEASLEDVDLQITPSKDELTEDNVEHLPDVSMPIATETVASTVASSQDPRNLA